VSYIRSDLEHFELVYQEYDGCHQDRYTHPYDKVSTKSPFVHLVLQLDWGTNKGPEEVKAKDGHPGEHYDARKVERVSNQFANCVRDNDDKFIRIISGKIRELDIVNDDQDGGCDDDGQDVGAYDDPLKVLELRKCKVE